MTKSTAMILKGAAVAAYLLCTSVPPAKAQFISMNEPKRKSLKTSENAFKVVILEEEKSPLNFRMKIDNPTQGVVKAYLRNKDGFDFLESKVLSSDPKVEIKLNLAMLEDGEYIFVVKSNNGFFLKNFNLQSGDLMTARINGKDTMTVNRKVVLEDD
jgi:hypothetical protein